MCTVCEKDQCTGCMACVDICNKNAISIHDSLVAYNACIDEEKCVKCDACRKVCQVNNPITLNKPIYWVQGWANDQEIRSTSSSGGFASAISYDFFENGGAVCSCVYADGQFVFRFAKTKQDIKNFAGSKYIKSNPSGIYKEIRKRLQNNQKVLFIGLPCQVAAVKKVIGLEYLDNLYTIDLICHGTPSPKILEKYFEQYGVRTSSFNTIYFRRKGSFQVNDGKGGFTPEGVWDQYTNAFLNSLSYTENCYECRYASLKRVSDITLGDSWGSDLDESAGKSGISLALIQTDKGKELLDLSELHLRSVDLECAVMNNHQLKYPSIRPKGRARFFEGISKNRRFNKVVLLALPKTSIKQCVKAILIRLGLFKTKKY